MLDLVFPVVTPTIPPATHTNCFLVGELELVVVDPASVYEEEQEKLEKDTSAQMAFREASTFEAASLLMKRGWSDRWE